MADVRLPGTGTGSPAWWKEQLGWSAEVRQGQLGDMRRNVNAYRDELIASRPEAIRVNIEFEKTEQKRPQLFFRNPELRLKPTARTLRDASQPDPTTGQPRDIRKAVRIFREVLQRLAGDKGVDTKTLLDQVLFDVLCPAGKGAALIGYETFENGIVPVQIGEEPIPGGMPGSVLGLDVPMQPIYGSAPNVIYERYFASRISPAQLLIPPDWTDGDYSRDALYLGHDFYLEPSEAKGKGWQLPPSVKGSSVDDDDDRITPIARKGTRRTLLKCRQVFYFAQRLDSSVPHPLLIRRLVFVDGAPDPVVSQDIKDQRFDQRGRLTGGFKSLPIKVLTLRYVSDSPDPPSDCRISRRQSDELSEFRSQMVLHRRKAAPMRWLDMNGVVDEKVKDAIKRGEYYDIIPTDGDGSKLMGEIARANYPRENYAANDYLMADVDRQWAMGGNQQGVRDANSQTATAAALMSQATATRFSGEQGAVMRFWLSIMEGLSELVQLHADHEDYVELAGEQGAQAIEAWDKNTVAGDFLFDVVPDSSAPPDAAADRDLALNRYNLLANDPMVNRLELVRDTVEAYGGDPDRLTVPPKEPPPEKPKISLSIKGEDLNPEMPQYANVVLILESAGIGQMAPAQEGPPPEETGPAAVVDRERLRMAVADENDARSPGGLVGAGR